MKSSGEKIISIIGVLTLLTIIGYIAIEDPAHGENWGGSYGPDEVGLSTTSQTGTLDGNALTEGTGFIMAQGGSYTIKVIVSNSDKDDDIDTVVVDFPTAFHISGGSPNALKESGGNDDWRATAVGSKITFSAISDFPGVNQTGGGIYYDVSSKLDDAIDYTQSGTFLINVTAPGTTTVGAAKVTVSDSQTENTGAEYSEEYAVASVKVGDIFQYVTIKGANVNLTFTPFTPIGGTNPGDMANHFALVKKSANEKTYLVLGKEGIEYNIKAVGGVDAVYDMTIETHTVTTASGNTVLTQKEVKQFTGLHTSQVSQLKDTDGDGLYDFEDPDDDNDGWTDEQEKEKGTNPLDPTSHPTKAKKSLAWLYALIIVIVIAVILAYFYFRKKEEPKEEVIEGGGEVPREEIEEEVQEEVEEGGEEEHIGEAEEEVGVSEGEEVYEVPEEAAEGAEIAGAVAGEVVEDEEMRELEGLSGELDHILEKAEPLTCPNCGGIISPEDTVCPHCGAELEDVYICPNCGAEVPAGSTVCPNCGAVFE